MAREAEERLVQRPAALGVERGEELVLDSLDERPQPGELALAVLRERDRLAAAVVRVAPPLDQPTLLEPVQQADELAAVEAQGVRDRRLRLAGAFGEQRQHAVVVGAEADLFELLDRALLELPPE